MNIPVFFQKYFELQLNARRSPQELALRRLKKFHRLVSFLSVRSPYYARIIRENNIDSNDCTPEAFPVLTKRTLMEHFDEIITVPGITQFLTSNRSFLKLLYRPRPFEINSPLQPVIDGLNDLQPDVLSGYPSGLLVLARKQLAGELRIAPSFIETGGEPLDPEVRRVIERAFSASILNLYASTEHMLMALGDPRHNGMYLLEDDLIFELHQDHTCITNLFNRTLPLIRYRMDDVLEPAPCPVGQFPYQNVRDIVGRMEHAPVFMNRHGLEDFISPLTIVEFYVRNLRQFQIEVLGKTSFLFRAALAKGLEPVARDDVLLRIRMKLTEILQQKEMDNVSFAIEEVDDLKVDPKTGKFRLIIPRTYGAE